MGEGFLRARNAYAKLKKRFFMPDAHHENEYFPHDALQATADVVAALTRIIGQRVREILTTHPKEPIIIYLDDRTDLPDHKRRIIMRHAA